MPSSSLQGISVCVSIALRAMATDELSFCLSRPGGRRQDTVDTTVSLIAEGG